ncbi:MAG: hypothetical protein B6241_08875 [Spirochaetaceae bacterium 4572_59]|nr:MAG: hypothetical protein B6241_08875 [Spirochaetaceae bacterium 4572_59]
MNTKRLIDSLVMSIITIVVVLAVLFLISSFMIQEGAAGFFVLFLIAFLSGGLLFPLYYWGYSKIGEDTILASRVSDLELNDRDVREAVKQWIYIHYGKRAEGTMEFDMEDNGSVICRVTVLDEQ